MSESIEGKAPLRMSKKAAKVRNKAPAAVQITAEQLLREAKERDLEIVAPPPRQNIRDPEELAAYQITKRKEYEDNIRKNRLCIANWIKYAKWEESQNQLQRARSVYERGLDVDHRNISLWLQYAEFEMRMKQINHARNIWDRAVTIQPRVKQFWLKYAYMEEVLANIAGARQYAEFEMRMKQINHARNIWDRAVTIQPRVKQFWLKYAYMEEVLANIAGARQVFERWMEWEPDEQAWQTYINFEIRHKETERARDIWQRFIHVHHEPKNWIRYAKFEERNGFATNARHVFERAVEFFGEENMDEQLLLAFAKFEEHHKEHDRAKVIYRYALDTLPKNKTAEIFKSFTMHEKKFGERAGIENVIVSKRRNQYEEQIDDNPLNYDAWFDYLRLMENESGEKGYLVLVEDPDTVRDLYERAIANVPLQPQKRFWRRYIYLWIKYALYEETVVKDMEKTREVYKACLDLIPHKKFTFAKIWLYFAQFEIRQRNLTQARKILGTAIGKCPKDKLFRGYIDLEIQLREFDRCRLLYEKFLTTSPENCSTWIKFAEMETLLGDVERARAIFELAISQPMLDMPEVLWKAYIDFEIGQEETANARKLYHRLLSRTHHVKVWVSLAQFEASTGEATAVENGRKVYRKAVAAMREGNQEKEERLMLLEAWKAFEVHICPHPNANGTEESRKEVEEQFPRRVKKRRPLINDEGVESGWEEYYDYIFPGDESSAANLKLLAMAKAWKAKQADDVEADQPETSEVGAGEEKVREGDSDTDIEEDNKDSPHRSDSD